MLEIKNLHKSFGGVKAVNNCSFSVKPNTITALIGPNGAGKSTIFNLISSIQDVDLGNIYLDGNDITNLRIEEVSKLGISRMFQKSRLFDNLTVKENLLLALDVEDTKFFRNFFGKNKVTKEKLKEINRILEIVEMKEYLKKRAGDLSYGQKRLVELARVILKPHRILLLDEPVAGVNPKLRKIISKVLLDLKTKGETILLIEHDMNFTLGISDEVIVLDEGKLLVKGTPKEIKNNPKVLEAYLGE
ncbi:MAG: ABC transporter ATP-binding protein [archaeon]